MRPKSVTSNLKLTNSKKVYSKNLIWVKKLKIVMMRNLKKVSLLKTA